MNALYVVIEVLPSPSCANEGLLRTLLGSDGIMKIELCLAMNSTGVGVWEVRFSILPT